MNLLLLVPVLASTVAFTWCLRTNRGNCVRRAILFGWPLPLAASYLTLFAFVWPRWPSGITFLDELLWRASIVALFAPQTLVLFVIGVIATLFRPEEKRKASTLSAILLVVTFVGHLWTMYLVAYF
ncbi:MAG TPA: hypothetical protein VFY72_07725 [Beijerinckiaceae bacterium]|nr:hypothetical protein [Beijerinckiaceae bacterium]